MYHASGSYNQVLNKLAGKEHSGAAFERLFYGAARKAFGEDMVKCTVGDDYYDKKNGTDFLLGAMRIDTTLNFSNKDNMPFIVENTGIPLIVENDEQDVNLEIGIRIGNRHNGYTEFDEAVVVIGANLDPSLLKSNWDSIRGRIIDNADKIREVVVAAYDDYMITNPEKRLELETTPLVPNENYKPPERISEYYRMINRLQKKNKSLEKSQEKNEEKTKEIERIVSMEPAKTEPTADRDGKFPTMKYKDRTYTLRVEPDGTCKGIVLTKSPLLAGKTPEELMYEDFNIADKITEVGKTKSGHTRITIECTKVRGNRENFNSYLEQRKEVKELINEIDRVERHLVYKQKQDHELVKGA